MIVLQFLWVVVLSCLVSGCFEPFSDHIKIDPTTVKDLRRQVPVYSESDVQTRAYVLLLPLSAISCKNKFWDPSPTQEEATDQLRVKAARLGGNGLLNVVCEEPSVTCVSKNCWAWLTCHGTAIQVTR